MFPRVEDPFNYPRASHCLEQDMGDMAVLSRRTEAFHSLTCTRSQQLANLGFETPGVFYRSLSLFYSYGHWLFFIIIASYLILLESLRSPSLSPFTAGRTSIANADEVILYQNTEVNLRITSLGQSQLEHPIRRIFD